MLGSRALVASWGTVWLACSVSSELESLELLEVVVLVLLVSLPLGSGGPSLAALRS